MRAEKLSRRDAQLAGLLAYIRDTQAPRLRGYHGADVDLILRLLRQTPPRPPPPPYTAAPHGLPSAAADDDDGRTSDPVAAAGPRTSPRHWEHLEDGEHDLMHEIAHGLHFASIGMLGFLVLEVSDHLPTPHRQRSCTCQIN